MNRDNNPNIKGFPMFLLSLIPGAAHMYMGLMKRGVQLLLSFCVVLGILSVFSYTAEIIFLPLIAVIFVYSFFDGYSCLRQIRSGVNVPDEGILSEFISVYGKNINRTWAGIAVIIIGLFFALSVLSHNRNLISEVRKAADFVMDMLPAVLLLIFGIVLIVNNRKNNKMENDNGDGVISIEDKDA